ncbi:24646_t:CDS:1, partial [Gigaspora rosea]
GVGELSRFFHEPIPQQLQTMMEAEQANKNWVQGEGKAIKEELGSNVENIKLEQAASRLVRDY